MFTKFKSIIYNVFCNCFKNDYELKKDDLNDIEETRILIPEVESKNSDKKFKFENIDNLSEDLEYIFI